MNEPKENFARLLKKYENDPELIAEGVLISLNEQIVKLMEEKKVSRVQLAKRLNCSPAYITKLLNGNENLTIKKITQIACALETGIEITLTGKNKQKQNHYMIVADRHKGVHRAAYARMKRN